MASGGEQIGSEIPADIARLPVGDALRTRREQLGWSLPDVAAWLRIRLPYLDALEGGDVSRLPGNAYAMGFLRAYANALGLDADDMARRFRGETKDVTRKPELSFPVPVPERGVPAGAIVLLGVVMVVAAYVGWFELGGRSLHEAHTVPPVPDALNPYAGTAGRGPSPQVATVMPGPGQTPSPVASGSVDPGRDKVGGASPETAGVAAEMPALPHVAGPTASAAATVGSGAFSAATTGAASVTSAAPAVQTGAALPATTVPAGTAGPAAAPTTSAPPVAPAPVATGVVAAAGQVVLNAVSDSWVQVRQVGGKVIYDHILQAGEHWSVPADAGEVLLSTGNAGGLTVSADGVTSAVLGRVGGVRRGIPLTAAAVTSGSIAAADGGGRASSVFGAQAATSARDAPVAPPPAAASSATAGSSAQEDASSRTAARPRPVARRSGPAGVEDETERLNRAQLKQPAAPQ